MGLAFLAPLALAAAALVAVPWILHHIRRPEREPVRFSSLMFVPEIKKEVIERRRLQHLLLMLLRMIILVLLAYAFARPYVPIRAEARDTGAEERHVILLDNSYSMGMGGAFAAAREAARTVVDGLDAADRVAVVTFAGNAQASSPMGSADDARAAIDAAALGHGSTDYEAALRRAVDLLMEAAPDPEGPRLFLHLISDFQRQGLSERATGWRVPSNIAFDPIEVGQRGENRAVTDVAVREPESGQLQVRARVRNWSRESGESVTARLVTDGQVRETKEINVAPGNASQVVFGLAASGDTPTTGWIEVDDEALAEDNRRYFTWNPEQKQRVLVVDDASGDTRWPAAKLLAYALPDTPRSPWDFRAIRQLTPEDLSDCDLVIIAGSAVEPGVVLPYIENGGRALLCLGETLNEELLRVLGVESAGLRYPDTSSGRFNLLSWVDFEHPVFHPFADARFNDFSDVHFFNHRLLKLSSAVDPAPRVVARFESADEEPGPPAMLEVSRGTGRVLVWAFPLDLQWTTLPRTPRFLPLLHESLAFLDGESEVPRAWQVGDRATPPRPGWVARQEAAMLDAPGFLEWREETEQGRVRVEPVNVFAAEGDPMRITPEEFALRLCSAPVTASAGKDAAGQATENALEYGRYVVGVLLAALLMEFWYASRLAIQGLTAN